MAMSGMSPDSPMIDCMGSNTCLHKCCAQAIAQVVFPMAAAKKLKLSADLPAAVSFIAVAAARSIATVPASFRSSLVIVPLCILNQTFRI